MKLSLLLLSLACAVGLRAANYTGDQTFSAPFNLNDSVNVAGNLTFATPGTYSASHWNVVGMVRSAAPGDYVIHATSGGFAASGNVVGPATGGVVTVRLGYRTTVNFVGNIASNITVVDDSARLPDTPIELVTTPPPAPLMNISARATLGAGGTLTPGFVIGGTAPRRVLVRAIGPGLAAFGVSNAMANPKVTIFKGALQVGTNDDWNGDALLQATFPAVGAFALRADSRDAAVVLTLSPGAYTAVVSGANASDAGEVLVEVYYVE